MAKAEKEVLRGEQPELSNGMECAASHLAKTVRAVSNVKIEHKWADKDIGQTAVDGIVIQGGGRHRGILS